MSSKAFAVPVVILHVQRTALIGPVIHTDQHGGASLLPTFAAVLGLIWTVFGSMCDGRIGESC